MRMEFRRLTGESILGDRPWQKGTLEELLGHAKAALMGFYDNNQNEFWPKEQFRCKAPEQVRIVDEAGNVVAQYDIRNIIADTGRELTGIKHP